jgi:hypothetical protein
MALQVFGDVAHGHDRAGVGCSVLFHFTSRRARFLSSFIGPPCPRLRLAPLRRRRPIATVRAFPPPRGKLTAAHPWWRPCPLTGHALEIG